MTILATSWSTPPCDWQVSVIDGDGDSWDLLDGVRNQFAIEDEMELKCGQEATYIVSANGVPQVVTWIQCEDCFLRRVIQSSH